MKQLVFFLISLYIFHPVYSQQTLPGGVKGASLWEVTTVSKPGEALWESRFVIPQEDGLLIKGKSNTINNNPAMIFSGGANSINSALELGLLESFSLFTVCQELDSISEGVILSLENESEAELLLTNRRMAALNIYRYVNYDESFRPYPKIYSYTQNRSENSRSGSLKLRFGQSNHKQNLPVSAYSGLITSEVILFTRYISPKERQQVESYLAIKYGISLNQELPASYLNSKGEIIWDSEQNAAYNQNIGGIGRDDLSGLYQGISESTQTPGAMKIAALNDLSDNSFLIWGDNGLALRFADESGIRKLLRDWKISTFNFERDSLDFLTDVMALHQIDPLHEGEVYWLMIDKSGSGKYPFRQTVFNRCLPMSNSRGIIQFSSVIIDDDNSGSDVFTLVAAPPFFLRSILKPPTCYEEQSGTISTEIVGGMPPFEITLRGINSNSFMKITNENRRDHVFRNISQGSYILQLTDANNNLYVENIWVSNIHLWESSINTSYDLVEGEKLVLNASEGMPAVNYIYLWSMPDGSSINNEEIEIYQPGNYLLSVTDENNCNSTFEVNVRQADKSNIRKVELFPNPASYLFVLRISLDYKADVMIIVSDMSGNILKQKSLINDQYYIYSGKIQKPGAYLITLISGNEKETLKLIVN